MNLTFFPRNSGRRGARADRSGFAHRQGLKRSDVYPSVVWLERQCGDGGADLPLRRPRPASDDRHLGPGAGVVAVDHAQGDHCPQRRADGPAGRHARLGVADADLVEPRPGQPGHVHLLGQLGTRPKWAEATMPTNVNLPTMTAQPTCGWPWSSERAGRCGTSRSPVSQARQLTMPP